MKVTFIYLDKKGNELTRKDGDEISLKDARRKAKYYLSNSMMNDLHKILVVKNEN